MFSGEFTGCAPAAYVLIAAVQLATIRVKANVSERRGTVIRRGTDSFASLPARPHALLELLAEVLHHDDARQS